MRPERQVRRYGTRPVYGRRRAEAQPSRSFSLPQINLNWIKWAGIGVAALIILNLISSSTKLEHISITGTRQLDPGHVQRVAEAGTDHQWFGRNTLLVNTSGLASYMQKAEPGIKSASIHRHGLHGLAIAITERQPSLNWKTNGTLYLLDADGTIIQESKGPYVNLPTITDSSNLPVKTGTRVAPASFVAFCSQVAKLLPQAGLKVVDMTIPETTSEVYVKTDKGFSIKFDTTRSAAGEVEDLQAVQAELAKAHKTPSEYIDLRIEHKAYYK